MCIKRNLCKLFFLAFVATSLLFTSEVVMAQNLQVSGTVTDKAGEPVVGAYVQVQGTRTGTSTNIDGKYSLNAPSNGTLVVTLMGYETVYEKINGRAVINIVLSESAETLKDVVIVGYGTQRKANLTGAVASVDVAKTLEAKATSDLGKSLQGAVPGLTILNTRGKIGDDPSIVIRGIGTLSNSGTSTPLYIVDGVPIDNISFLNSQDIESISVLKDAASASIYGTRAAFGVVLITTKTAKTQEKAVVSYTNNFGWSRATVLPDYPTVMEQVNGLLDANNRAGLENELFGMYMDSPEFLAGVTNWQNKHGKKALYRDMVEGDDYISGVGYFADWDVQRILFNRAAPSQNHTVSVQGVSGNTNYYVSFGYDRQQGLMKFNPDVLNKYSATVNVSSKVSRFLEIGARVGYVNKDYQDPTDAMRSGDYQYLWRWGSFFGPWGTINGVDARNTIAYRMQAGDSYTKRDALRLGGFAKFNIIEGLTLNADFTYLFNTMRYKQANIPVRLYNTWSVTPEETTLNTSTNVIQEQEQRRGWNTNIYGNYRVSFADAHNLNFMLGFNADASEYEWWRQKNNTLLDDNLQELILTKDLAESKSAHSKVASAGFFGRINYDYKGKYLLELNGRYDGSSKFPANDRWAFFPSASAGWRISEEPFFESLKPTLSSAKLRASYGVVGNQEVGADMYLQTIERYTSNVNWLGNGNLKYDNFGMPKLVSATLTWESLATTNIGLDLGFMGGDLNVSFDWFQRDTKEMLAPGQTMPQVLGASAANENAGSLRSRGWEFNIEWRHNFNGVNVYAIGNIGDYKTTVTKWNNNSTLLNSNYSGKRYGDIWGFKTDRYFTSADFNGVDGSGKPIYASGVASQRGLEQGAFVFGPGDIKFVDVNGDGVIDGGDGTAENHGDLVVIGNTQPRYQYSLRIGGEWNGFDLDLFFQGVGKRNMWTQSAFVMPLMRGADAIYKNQTSYVTDADYKAGNIDQNATYPRMFPGNAGQGTISVISGGNHNFYPQSKYLVNMAYLRLKNITLGYTLPKNITQKVRIDKIRVYASITNAFDIINHTKKFGLDPEVNTGNGSLGNGVWGRTDPFMRTYSCGLQFTF